MFIIRHGLTQVFLIMALNSTSSVRLVDLLCEGPIEGFDAINEQIFLDETPLFTGNDPNFPTEDVDVDFRLGGRRQRTIAAGRQRGNHNHRCCCSSWGKLFRNS